MRKRLFLLALCLLLFAPSASIADYAMPIDFEVYNLVGNWDMDFVLTDAIKNKIVTEWPQTGLTVDKVQLFPDARKWTARNVDLYNLANCGVRGVTTLPLAPSGSGNVYVARCSFGDDVNVGERIDAYGFQVDTTTLQTIYDTAESLSDFVYLDEDLNRVFTVPKSKKIYLATLLKPETMNTGILTVIRGKYVVEDDPADRLNLEFAQTIADTLGIDVKDLKYLSQVYLGKPVAPTEAMKAYVKSDDHEIIANLPTLSVDKEGYYAVKITLADDVWEKIHSDDIGNYKIYGLNDSDLGDTQFQPAFITGLINTWELFTMQGKKMTNFGAKEFLMVGLLNAGKPFSFYLGKLLLTILLGGCNTLLFAPVTFAVAAVVFFAIKFMRKKI